MDLEGLWSIVDSNLARALMFISIVSKRRILVISKTLMLFKSISVDYVVFIE